MVESLPAFVESLTPHTFHHKVANSNRPALVYFYTPCKSTQKNMCVSYDYFPLSIYVGCGHCQHFAPVFDDVALELRHLLLTAKVDCERFGNLCAHARIRAYPTVRFFPGDDDEDSVGVEITNRSPENIIRVVEEKLHARTQAIRHDEL